MARTDTLIRTARRGLLALLCAALLVAGGCGLLLDEFFRLDRAAPEPGPSGPADPDTPATERPW